MDLASKACICIFLIFFCLRGKPQAPVPDLKNVTFSSPNVANMTKFGNIPIGLFTGTPNITVPIYTIKVGDISLPIKLDYHASGIKVSEIASWAGLGWNLDCGGMITREVRGLMDETLNGGYVNGGSELVQRLTNYEYPFFSSGFLTASYVGTYNVDSLDGIRDGSYDGQADLFHFSCGKYSGNFFFNSAGTIVQVPQQNVTIQGNFTTWTITTPEGLIYTYGPLYEMTSSNPGPMANKSSWFLTAIADQYGNQVLFKYKSYMTYCWNFGSETKGVVSPNPLITEGTILPPSFDNIQDIYNVTYSYVPDSIITKNETVILYSDTSRQDIPGENKLDSIRVISNLNGNIVRQTNFFTSNFQGGYSAAYSTNTANIPNTPFRLRLDSLETDNIEKYKFYYDSTSLPERLSYDQDMWGYYNAAGNQTMVPNFLEWLSATSWISIPGGNRLPNANTASACTLAKIVYPTGGYTTFAYELNTINDRAYNELPYLNPLIPEAVGNYSATATTQGYTYSGVIEYPLGSSQLVFTFIGLATSNSPFNWSVALVDSATLGLQFNQTITAGMAITPPAGQYVIRTQITGGTNPSYSYAVYANWTIPAYSYSESSDTTWISRQVGGIRIKEMDDYDPIGQLTDVKKYYYTMPDSVSSSGQIVDYPILARVVPYLGISGLSTQDGCGETISNQINMQLLTSYSSVPIAINSGEVIGYSYVTEEEGTGANIQRKAYQYTNVSTNPDIKAMPQFDFPATPYSSQYFNRGLLLDEKSFKNTSGAFFKVRETTNYYSCTATYGDPVYSAMNIMAIQSPQIFNVGNCSQSGVNANTLALSTAWSTYETIAGYNNLDSSIVMDYDQNDTTKFVRNATSFTYIIPTDSYSPYQLLLPRSKTFVNSKGESILSNYKYAFDLAGANNSTTLNQGVNNLLSRGLFTRLVEVSNYENPAGSQILLNSNFFSYNVTAPEISQQFAIDNGMSISNFTPASVVSQNIQMDPNYILKISKDGYDSYGNLLQQHKAYDNNHSYLWDYHASYPIAEVVNAAQSDIAYTSFEADGTGNWTIPDTTRNRTTFVTGNHSYNLNSGNTITAAGLNSATTYIVSYWSTGGSLNVNGTTGTAGTQVGAWTYYEHQVSGASTISVSGTATIDELRLFPKGALMTTYTYSPLVGISSQCSPTNYVTYYNYDNLFRLKAIKDMRGNVVKTYDYHYQNQ